MVKRGKSKMGRPNVLVDPIKIAFWLEREAFEAAKKAAERRGVSLSEVVRAAISRLAREKPKPRRREERE